MTITSSSAAWLSLLASPAAPKSALSPLALEGYLTGVVVAPNLIPPSRWIAWTCPGKVESHHPKIWE